MEYVVGALWSGLELVCCFLFNGAFLTPKEINKNSIYKALILWLIICIYSNILIDQVIKQVLTILILTILSVVFYRGKLVVHLCLVIICYVFITTIDAAIVTVDDNGGITPVSVGTATIRASAKEDPGISDTCEVTVWDSCGDNVRWYVLEDGATMVIDGTGPIADSANPMKQPWKNVRAKITEIKLGSDITAIGNLSFAGFNKLASLDIPEGSKLESIGKNAFMGTSKLTEIYLPGTLKRIDDTNIGNKEKIHYRGTAADWEKLNYKAAKATVYVLDEAGNEVEYVADPYKCGADARYSFDSDGGVLTITGTGATEDYTSVANNPVV